MRFRPLSEAEAKAAGGLFCEEASPSFEVVDAASDSATVEYVVAVRPAFEILRYAAAQLAAWFLVVELGDDPVGPDHPLLTASRGSFAEALDGLRSVRVTRHAEHHYRHLRRAELAVGEVLDRLRDFRRILDAGFRDAALVRLRAGWEELHLATALLPGFEMVQLSGSCCAEFRRILPPLQG